MLHHSAYAKVMPELSCDTLPEWLVASSAPRWIANGLRMFRNYNVNK
jgi:hypothetical protein